MKEHIPFVYTKQDAGLVASTFHDAPLVRVTVDVPNAVLAALPASTRCWVDGGVDAFNESWPPQTADLAKILSDCGGSKLANESFRKRPVQQTVREFVDQLLDECRKKNPVWLSVPQLPFARDGGVATINKALATAAGDWKKRCRFAGQLVLPLVLVHVEQTHLKAKRTAIIKQADAGRVRATADGMWVVVCGLDDQSGSRTNDRKTFPGLVALHEEIREAFPKSVFVVAGPYWGMNVVLWARGLADYTASGVGGGFRYFISGGVLRPGKTRIAVSPLKRLAIASQELVRWIEKAENDVPPGSPARRELADLKKLFPHVLRDKDVARRQVASWYLDWLRRIEQVPQPGRALALYQDLSSAYVVGKSIKEKLPKAEDVTRPERIAQQLMMSCL